MIMPWGDFRGKEIEDIPSNYLKWLAENCKDDSIATVADKEWTYREEFDCHIEDDREPPRKRMWWN